MTMDRKPQYTIVPAAAGQFATVITLNNFTLNNFDERPAAEDLSVERVPIVAWCITTWLNGEGPADHLSEPILPGPTAESNQCVLVELPRGSYGDPAPAFDSLESAKRKHLANVQRDWDDEHRASAEG
jgi:hypothetical protein